jgi:hypothetical protein
LRVSVGPYACAALLARKLLVLDTLRGGLLPFRSLFGILLLLVIVSVQQLDSLVVLVDSRAP